MPNFFVTTYGNRIPLANYTIFYSLPTACIYTFKHIAIHSNLLTLLSYHRQTRDIQFGTIQEVDMSLQIQIMKNN